MGLKSPVRVGLWGMGCRVRVEPGFGFRDSGFRVSGSSFGYRGLLNRDAYECEAIEASVSGSGVSGSRFRVSGIEVQNFQRFGFRVSEFRGSPLLSYILASVKQSQTRFRVPKFRASGSEFKVSGFRVFKVSGFRVSGCTLVDVYPSESEAVAALAAPRVVVPLRILC